MNSKHNVPWSPIPLIGRQEIDELIWPHYNLQIGGNSFTPACDSGNAFLSTLSLSPIPLE